MTKTELLEIIGNGENSGIEFKRDDVHPDALAKEMSAFLNLEGGRIILGVEDNGDITGLTRTPEDTEEWIMGVARAHLQPPVIPYWEKMQWDQARTIGIVSLPSDAPDKPYKAKRGSAWTTFVRVGSTSRESTREEESRLYQQSGLIRYELRPALGSDINDLDLKRLTNYFRDIRSQECPPKSDQDGWHRLLLNTDFMVEDRGKPIPTVSAMILFGLNPNRYLPQAGVSAAAYDGTEKDYSAKERNILRGPAVALLTSTGDDVVEAGVIEQAIYFVRRNIRLESKIDTGGRRQERWDYPLEAIREAIVNAIVHRDYTIAVMDIELSIYDDRLEVISPGRLPNTVTVEKIRVGYRASRNEHIKEILRDYRYVEANGLGVPRKIIRGMQLHNGTDPDLIEEEDRFIVRLWKERKHDS